MVFNFDTINIFILLVVVSNSILAGFVYLTNKSSVINKSYFLFAISATMWGLSMFLFRSFPENIYDSLLARFLYASAAAIPYIFLYFIRFFPTDTITISQKNIELLSVPFLFVFSISLIPNMLIVSSYSVNIGEPIIVFNSFFHTIYALYITTYFSLCYAMLFYKYYKTSGNERVQVTYVMVGTLIATLIGVTTNLLMPYFGNFSLNWMGQIGVISMVGAIAYAIMKHKLFDMKVLVTEFTVVILCIALFTKVLFSVDFKDYIINNTLLVVVMIVGIFLIKSVVKEVHLRELLNDSNKNLKIANEGQVSLMHFMNHQVKGRFGNAKNIFAELMTEDYGIMPEESLPLLRKGLEETNMGIDYVQNVLRGNSAENGKLSYDLKPLDFKQIVESSYIKDKERAETKGLVYNINIDQGEYNILGDARQLGEAIRNLIDNSINYTPHGDVNIYLSSDKYAVKLEVADTGVGITKEDKVNLFKSGFRGKDSLKINVNSTGYGLAFVKGVVDFHKGRVWMESKGKNKGTSFFVELPKG